MNNKIKYEICKFLLATIFGFTIGQVMCVLFPNL